LSGELIGPGDFYFEDDEDGWIVKASVYYQRKEQRLNDIFDWSKLENATSQEEYRVMLLEAEREHFEQTLFERPIAGKDVR
jgi:hypothetical protein